MRKARRVKKILEIQNKIGSYIIIFVVLNHRHGACIGQNLTFKPYHGTARVQVETLFSSPVMVQSIGQNLTV